MANASNEVERWEFGCLEWVQYAAKLGVRLIEEAGLDLRQYEWGFSEEYTHIPERLLAGRDKAGYHLMIHDGNVSGGPFLRDECLALLGFHVSIDWALIAHSSYYPFNTVGRKERLADHASLRADLRAAGVAFRWLGPGEGRKTSRRERRGAVKKGTARCPGCGSSHHGREDCPVWPPGVGEALASSKDNAKRLLRSPELEGLPETAWGVPIFSEMTEEQKARFVKLLGG